MRIPSYFGFSLKCTFVVLLSETLDLFSFSSDELCVLVPFLYSYSRMCPNKWFYRIRTFCYLSPVFVIFGRSQLYLN
jgi:hypothetical protein